MRTPVPAYTVVPIERVKSEARKILSPDQLAAAIEAVKLLAYYPRDVGLSYERCGDGFELRIEDPSIGKQGWLRAFFWVYKKTRTIYVVDLFWKKTRRVSTADLLRVNHRIRRLKAQLAARA